MKNRSNNGLSFLKLFLYAVLILTAIALILCIATALLGGKGSPSADHDAAYDKILADFSAHKSTISLFTPCDIGQIGDIYTEVTIDHPEFFWDRGAHITKLRLPFFPAAYIKLRYLCDPGALPSMIQRMDSAVDTIVQQANEYATDEEKALFVHDYLVSNCAYDDELYRSGYPKSLSYTCYGCLVDQVAVFQGYAEAYQLIMNRLGIECGLVPGTAVIESEISSHAWNYIRLGDEYYMVDVTWDDPIGYSGPVRHDFFCLTEEQMGTDHFPDEGWHLPDLTA